MAQVYIAKLSAANTSKSVDLEAKKSDQEFIREGFELAVKVVTDQRNDALGLIKDMRQELGEMQLEMVGLKLANSFDPFPRWMVDLEGRYIFINTCFEECYLVPRNMYRRDIIGKGHEVLWPEEFCQRLHALDAIARARPDGKARAVVEIAKQEHTLFKFPVRVQGVIVAYAGYLMENV